MRIKTYIKTDKNVFTWYQDYALFEFKGKKNQSSSINYIEMKKIIINNVWACVELHLSF